MSIMFIERLDEEKRKRGARATRNYPHRPVPFDFAAACKAANYRMVDLCRLYAADGRTIKRWCSETGVKLLTHNESARLSKPQPEFDPTKDGALLRQAISALVGRTS